MKQKLLSLFFISSLLGIIYVTNSSYSTGPPTSAATGGCTCHGASSGNTVVSIDFNSGNLNYVNGQTYPIKVSVYSFTNMPAAGFIINSNIGALSLNSSGVQIAGNYAMHTTPKASSGTGPAVTEWFVNWTAPASGNTPLQLVGAGNAVNLLNGNSGDQWNFASSVSVVLPLQDFVFDVLSSKTGNTITWKNENQKDISSYVIEVSKDGKSFEKLAQLEANQSGYEYLDATKYTSHFIYYRIYAQYQNDTKEYTNVKRIINTQYANTYSLFPSITKQNATVTLLGLESQASQVILYNQFGKIVHEATLQNNQFQIPDVASGIYFVAVKINNQVYFVDKMMVQ
ncbi:MAG: choice-of-anchor V domain-containing protein [Chitinophagaceae bacterium]